MLANEVDLFFSSYAAVQAHIAAKTIKVLGVTGSTRLRELAQVTTVAEQGFRGFEAYSDRRVRPGWHGRACRGPSAGGTGRRAAPAAGAGGLGQQGFEIVAGSPAELERLVRREHDKWLAVARKANIRFD